MLYIYISHMHYISHNKMHCRNLRVVFLFTPDHSRLSHSLWHFIKVHILEPWLKYNIHTFVLYRAQPGYAKYLTQLHQQTVTGKRIGRKTLRN